MNMSRCSTHIHTIMTPITNTRMTTVGMVRSPMCTPTSIRRCGMHIPISLTFITGTIIYELTQATCEEVSEFNRRTA